MDLEQLLSALSERLPELEWKMDNLGSAFNPRTLPKGLFNYENKENPRAYLDEIKQDLAYLRQSPANNSAQYIATRLLQKINVLVTVCNLYGGKQTAENAPDYRLDRLVTRQQWLQSLAQEITTLEGQLEALQKQKKIFADQQTAGILSLQSEIGEIEKRLTLAREAYNQAIV